MGGIWGSTPTGALVYKGAWDANANSPALASGAGTTGDLYVVGTAGATALDGITPWAVGDQVVFNGAAWEKIPNVAPVASVAGKTGAVTLDTADIASGTFNDARIASSNVTQHEGDIDHDALTNTHNLTTDIDHGSIDGLADDDHTQYLLADGTRQLTGDLNAASTTVVYLGVSTVDGSWRIKRDGNNLSFERRESGSWVAKATMTP